MRGPTLLRPAGVRLARAMRDERGASLIEFSITLSVLLTFVFALMELCILFYTYGMISECAREGTRYAMVRGSTCQTAASVSCTASTTSITNYVKALGYPNPGGGTMVVTTTFPNTTETPGDTVKVSISYTFPIRFPFVPTNSLALSTYSLMTIVQ